MRNEAEREWDKRQESGEGWWKVGGAGVHCARTTEFLCWRTRHLYLGTVYGCMCMCISQPRPPWSPSIQTLLLIAHPNSLQTVAHDKTTEQNQICKQHCICAPQLHTEFQLLKLWETKYRNREDREDLQICSKRPSNPSISHKQCFYSKCKQKTVMTQSIHAKTVQFNVFMTGRSANSDGPITECLPQAKYVSSLARVQWQEQNCRDKHCCFGTYNNYYTNVKQSLKMWAYN